MVTTPKQSLSIPPLENGDRLSRSEFERRYQAMPRLKKAELIEGVVYIASPLRIRSHGEPHSLLITWLGIYKTGVAEWRYDFAEFRTEYQGFQKLLHSQIQQRPTKHSLQGLLWATTPLCV
jgi:hypothetical protein